MGHGHRRRSALRRARRRARQAARLCVADGGGAAVDAAVDAETTAAPLFTTTRCSRSCRGPRGAAESAPARALRGRGERGVEGGVSATLGYVQTELDARNLKSDGEAVSRFIEWEWAAPHGARQGERRLVGPASRGLIGTWTLLDRTRLSSPTRRRGRGPRQRAAAARASGKPAPRPISRRVRRTRRSSRGAPPSEPAGRRRSAACATGSSRSCGHRPRPAARRRGLCPSRRGRRAPVAVSDRARCGRRFQSRAPTVSARLVAARRPRAPRHVRALVAVPAEWERGARCAQRSPATNTACVGSRVRCACASGRQRAPRRP